MVVAWWCNPNPSKRNYTETQQLVLGYAPCLDPISKMEEEPKWHVEEAKMQATSKRLKFRTLENEVAGIYCSRIPPP